MNEQINFILKNETINNLKIFSQMLDKSIDEIMEEALDEYFIVIQKQKLEKNIADENAMTSLDYDEFWDGVDL